MLPSKQEAAKEFDVLSGTKQGCLLDDQLAAVCQQVEDGVIIV